MREKVQHSAGPWRTSFNTRGLQIVDADGKEIAAVRHRKDATNAPILAAALDGYALARELIHGDGTADSIQRCIDMAASLLKRVEA